jgi:hypothetical protein
LRLIRPNSCGATNSNNLGTKLRNP